MTLSDISRDAIAALDAMERYVNSGSPSGFTFSHTTSANTSPRSDAAQFNLHEIEARDGVIVLDLGEMPAFLARSQRGAESPMYVHPDMAGHAIVAAMAAPSRLLSSFAVRPTASARTVRIVESGRNGYLKLHDERYIGRTIRRLTYKHAAAALETDNILQDLLLAGALRGFFAFFRETGARVYQGAPGHEWGMVWRPAIPVGGGAKRAAFYVPAFSLFSPDTRHPAHPTLLAQLRDAHVNPLDFLLEDLLVPLLDGFFAMLNSGGLIGEWHSQNVVFGFDENWRSACVALRDMESVERDLPLMIRAGTARSLASYPYKCLQATDYNYEIKHSFLFDHKLGEYLLAPLIDHAAKVWSLSTRHVEQELVDRARRYVAELPEPFFPADGCWYKFENTLIDRSTSQRPYVRMPTPRFR